MKRLLILFLLIISSHSFAQLIATGATSKVLTNYTYVNPDDTIYVYCGNNGNGPPPSANLIALPTCGVAPFIFNWQVFDSVSYSYTSFSVDTGVTSFRNGLGTGGYNVAITDSNGAKYDMRCWVFIDTLKVKVDSIIPRSDTIKLRAHLSNTVFKYFDPPQTDSLIIDSTTTITVSFDGIHTYVSDLGFYLIGPMNMGSPSIQLASSPGFNCNNGNDFNNLRFTSSSLFIYDVCNMNTPLTGSFRFQTPWTSLYGSNTNSTGWSIQIYDCSLSDIGKLTHASIKFKNNNPCNQNSPYYDSGTINLPINDGACTPQNATIFTFNNGMHTHHLLNQTSTILWSSLPWGAVWQVDSVDYYNNNYFNQDTWFYATYTDNITGCSVKDSAKYWYSLIGEKENKNDIIVLEQNMPNPFNDKTVINYFIPTSVKQAELQLFNINGILVKTFKINQKGKGQITLAANNLNSGEFLYKLVADGKVVGSKKMICSK